MPSGKSKTTGKANCELLQCVNAKIAAHKGRVGYTNKLCGVCEYVLNVLVKPLSFMSDDQEHKELEVSDLTVALLNINTDLVQSHLEKDELYRCLDNIFQRINPYLPEKMKVNRFRFSKFNDSVLAEDTREYYRYFIDEILSACNKIEDKVTRNYYNGGGINKLEILKRRYRKNWGDMNRSVEVKTTDANDNVFEVIIKEA